VPAAPLVRLACPMRVRALRASERAAEPGRRYAAGRSGFWIRTLTPRDGEQVIVQLIHMRENETVRRTFVHLGLTIRK
jgi:hypothetical protein